ncbi:FHA domain-containing protein [Oceanicoccus sagamiensis]|uniref:FHA domain-containing protein n=1 Tax=Oceanicoccus sagamiensis TaxID=716816 RepID=A0A1X9ND17_9GAMM|nr:FHA domain-containing protein [Oceanicoccus sagamiensis]ARN75938.1 hypothetical protein BST96_18650 [Oceanicoccus sagamiensis]
MASEDGKLASTASTDNNQWELVAEGDWLVGQRFGVKHHAVLGRDSSCDITIPGTHLSRRHAELAVKGPTLLIRDLGSSNGTYVNDERVTETELKPGDTVRFDVLVFRVQGPELAPIMDSNATMIRRVPTKKPAAPRPAPEPKNWKVKPTSVGNRESTVQMTTLQKASHSVSTILAVLMGIATLAALGYLFTQL